MPREVVSVNRAPVLTLWASVVAERLGYDHEAALSLGKALAGLNAQSKGRRLGIYKPPESVEGLPPKKARRGEEFWVQLLGRPIPTIRTGHGVRAVEGDRPIEPAGVERYLQGKFGEAFDFLFTSISGPVSRKVCGDGAPKESWTWTGSADCPIRPKAEDSSYESDGHDSHLRPPRRPESAGAQRSPKPGSKEG
jgi:hypothetical protein